MPHMIRFRRLRVFTVALVSLGLAAAAGVAAPAALAAPSTVGSTGAGDPYFPLQGNGGYDVAHYALSVAYTPATRRLVGQAVVTARATQALTRFDLDLRRNLHVSSVRVNGTAAHFAQPARLVQELVITPAHRLVRGEEFVVEVRYAGTARPTHDPDGSVDGFVPTDDGADIASEPQGAPTWFPVNDTPRDKATYQVTMTVPRGLVAVGNGRLLGHTAHGSTVAWSWRLDQPVSSYLVTATIGRFRLIRGVTPGGVPYLDAIDPRVYSQALPVVQQLPAIIDYFSSVYGPYPFGQAGAIIDTGDNLGYALETATRPLFDRPPGILTFAHELAHQWFGDGVTLQRWRGIWLNEGFAEFSSWLWDEHTGGLSAAGHLQQLLAHPAADTAEWLPPPGNPGDGKDVFAGSVYDRGAGTLEALRQKLGDPTFFAIMRGWAGLHRYANATVAEFIAYAEQVSHQDLRAFFHDWLYRPAKPTWPTGAGT